jgi:hypothetical protein
VAMMRAKAEDDQKVSDAELIALWSKTQEEISRHGGTNKSNLRMHDFTRKLLKACLTLTRMDETDSALILKQEWSIFDSGRTPWLLANFTTHHHRRCPYCHGAVYRERQRGLSKLTLVIGVRRYRCANCDRLHYGFCF